MRESVAFLVTAFHTNNTTTKATMSSNIVVQHEEQTVDSADGTTLYVQSWRPSLSPAATSSSSRSTTNGNGNQPKAKAHLIFCHGYLEHSGRYREVCEYMAQFHILSTVFDFRGHGQSAGPLGYVTKFSDFHDDIKAVVVKTAADNGGGVRVPIFVLGHSNGGLAVLDWLLAENNDNESSFYTKHNIKGVTITSPFLAPANEISYGKVVVSKILGYILPRLALPANEVTSEILTHDEMKRAEHRVDPAVQSKFTLGWAVQGMAAQKRVLNDLKKCPVPLLFMYAGDDQVANPHVNESFAAAISSSDKTVVRREGEYHEILNETMRTETFALIKDWSLQRCG
jgi:alpha-beta hydrolase superfamily lysophospholipase